MDYLKINKRLWNDKTPVHYASDFYNVKSFLKGWNSLNSIESELPGKIHSKMILHLQCHFGVDTINRARRGAIATGIDLSDQSINSAINLNNKAGTNAKFIESHVYSLPDSLDKKFDIVSIPQQPLAGSRI